MKLLSGYLESRGVFTTLAARLGVEARSFLYEDEDDQVGLSTDVAYLGSADAQSLVIIASGTHGVEGYAGAACQFRFMETYPARFASRRIAWLLVHAVNPWGFHHDRRVTREGLDLNRYFVDFPVADFPHLAYGTPCVAIRKTRYPASARGSGQRRPPRKWLGGELALRAAT